MHPELVLIYRVLYLTRHYKKIINVGVVYIYIEII
jgi:hypothetical protein